MKEESFSLFKLLGWSLILYLFIFQPIISKYIYLGVELLLVLVLFFKHHSLFRNNYKLFRKEYFFVGLICGYSLLVDAMNFNIVFLDRFLASFFQGYLMSLLFIFCISRSLFLQKYLSECIVFVCFIACGITTAAILIPSFGQFCMNHATMDARERLQELYIDGGMTQYRSYGLSESLNFTYAYVLSFIGGYTLCEKLKLYTPILLLMILVAILFNARIAFVPLMVAVFYLVFLKKKTVNGVFSFLGLFVVVVLLSGLGLSVFPELNNEWGLSFFSELYAFLTGEDAGTIGTLTGSMWIIPNNVVDFIFGTGQNIFYAKTNYSDVGYILQLNYGGVILLSLILFYFVYISRRILHSLSVHHWFPVMFIISVFVLNFKGFYLAALPGNRFLTFLYVYFIYASKRGIYELSPMQKLV